jgi:hypothetical protein
MRFYLKLILLSCAIMVLQPLSGQISQGGKPLSFLHSTPSIPTLEVKAPDMEAIARQDAESEKQGLPLRVGIALPLGTSINQSGAWEILPDGSKVWRLRLACQGAMAISVSFDEFHLPPGARLFAYNDDRSFLIGAFTSLNNPIEGMFSTELVPGEAMILELESPSTVSDRLQLSIDEISYLYRFLPEFINSRGTSDDCEVNVNCPEGENWQKQKRSVVRIYVKKASAFFWCTGTLLNNERMDRSPFLLTANHCAPDATPDDLNQWVFYFNYEAPGCENPPADPPTTSMVGASLLSEGDVSGSDFILLLLNDTVPQNYSPFYAGWNAQDVAGEEGVTIHHPSGDIKKISTYTEPVISSQWSGTPNTHWQVYWTGTESGWGVTEGGSSGAPLFNENGMVIGTLTGGLAACDPGGGGPGTGPDKPDYYGKFSYSWDQNGDTPDKRLKDWLDPDNTGVSFLPGMNAILTADFITESRLILTGTTVTFSDLSSGPPLTWEWHFEGGDPETFLGKDPPEITYAKGGKYDVTLVVSDGQISDTLTRAGYVEVVGNLFPNPARDEVSIYLGEEAPATLTVEVINIIGRVMYTEKYTQNSSRLVTVNLSNLSSGIYIIRLQVGQRYLFGKVMVINE